MGTTYFVANVSKRQYFDPGAMGWEENTKRSGILWGLSGHALALLLLPDVKLEFHLVPWIGDPLVLVGDENSANSIDLLRPFQRAMEQDAYHIVTEQFVDISLNLISLLCKTSHVLSFLLDSAEQSTETFVDLAHTIMYLPAKHIEIEFAKRFGTNWRDRYTASVAREPWHCRMPMTTRSE
jgi:hypothetical protein